MLCHAVRHHTTPQHTSILPHKQAIYSPSAIDGRQVLQYENGLAAANAQMLQNFNTSLLLLKPASEAGEVVFEDGAVNAMTINVLRRQCVAATL